MNTKNRRIFTYWAVGVLILTVAWMAYYLSQVIGGLLTVLTSYGNVTAASALGLAIILFWVTALPYMLGRILIWVVSKEILREKLETDTLVSK